MPQLSLVADNGQLVVGHVMATRATVGPNESPVLGLGPLGVLPSHQRQGVGTVLMEAIIGIVESSDEPMIVLLGEPAYYHRFGFEPAATLVSSRRTLGGPRTSWCARAARMTRPFVGSSPTRSRSRTSEPQLGQPTDWGALRRSSTDFGGRTHLGHSSGASRQSARMRRLQGRRAKP